MPPEKLLRAMLFQASYSIRSERLLMERLEYDLLFRWFVGIGVDDAAWDHSVFSKNRDRLLEGDIAAKFLAAVLAQPKVKKLLSSDHFSVDGTLIEAWASMKSVKPKDGSGEPPAQGGGRNAEADFHGQKRSNDTHASTTDPDASLYRKGKGKETKLCFIGHGLMENRHGLLIDARLTRADGHAETVAALHMIEPRCRSANSGHAWRRQSLRRRRLRQRAAFDERDAACCAEHRRPQLCDRRAKDPARRLSRKRIEEAFG
nr:IS5 family transposase [Bradyrhizobium zhanjiangense]